MIIEILSTGDEVLTGFIVDTNAPWICQELLSMGLYVSRRHTVSDKLEDLTAILKERSQVADLIIISGGLGPTSDDNTSLAAAHAAKDHLVMHPEWVERLKQWHIERNRPMAKTNLKQAELPSTATLIDNPCGTACGFYLKINKALCFFTPGVPNELKVMFSSFIKPYIKKHFKLDDHFRVKSFFMFGISESKLGQMIESQNFDDRITIGYRAAYPLIELKAIINNCPNDIIDQTINQIRTLCKNYIICEDQYNLAERLTTLVKQKTIAIFDELSSGLLAYQLAPQLNIKVALYSHNLNVKDIISINKNQYDYLLITKAGENQENIEFIIVDNNQHQQANCKFKINLTLQNYLNDVIALIGQSSFYNYLSGKPLIIPDHGFSNINIKHLS